MTDTPKPDALLAVTQADQQLYLDLGIFHTCEDRMIFVGWADDSEAMQKIARHRLASAPAAAVEGREIVEAAQAAALRMWRVHPNDLDDMDYKHVGRGGRYDNPRAAYYADEIMKIVSLAAPSAPHPQPAEVQGLVEAASNLLDVFETEGLVSDYPRSVEALCAALAAFQTDGERRT